MGPRGMNFDYFLISNIYILFIFIYQYLKNKQWFVKYYIIGRALQLMGILLMDITRQPFFTDTLHMHGLLIIVGMPFEIFGLISYNEKFNKERLIQFMLLSGLLLLLLVIPTKIKQINIISIDTGTFFFFLFGGIQLIKKKDNSKFRLIIGYSFIIYALFRLAAIISTLLTANPEFMLPPPDNNLPQQIPQLMPPPDHRGFNIAGASQTLMYFVSIISSISYLIILKEQDELAIARINKQIAKENKNLKALDEEKNKFFSIVAHDLKNPIGTLASISEMLVDKKSKLQREDYERWIAIIKESTTRTYTFLNNLLQWARSESGTLNPNPVILNSKEITNEIIRLMDTYAQNKQIEIHNNCPDDVVIYADKEMISTVLRNLISNAIKFTNKEGVISIDAKKGKTTTMSVTDSGVGIKAEKAKNIFNLDSSHSTDGTENEKGTGLGLKLSYEFIEKNNGEIWLKSEPGKGSTFYFNLPSQSY